MSIKIENEYGNLLIDDHVISTIAGISAMECYGLVGMASKNATEEFFELVKKEQLSKGIKVQIKENKILIDLHVVVQFGVKISVVAQNIVSKVKYNVENYTGLEVEKVNIHIQGVRVLK